MNLSAIEIQSATQHRDQFISELLARSNGTLNNFASESILMILAETYALGFATLEGSLNQKITDITFQSVAKLLGATNFDGVKAQITLEILPQQINTVKIFRISAGFKVEINGVSFITTQEATINPGESFTRIIAESVDVGAQGNVRAGSQVNFISVDNLRLINVVGDPIRLGQDPQTFENVTNTLTQQFVSTALITVTDYQQTLTRLFPNLITKPVANLGLDKITKTPGTIHVFTMQKGATNITDLQKLAIAQSLKDGWATVFVSPFNLLNFSISVICKLATGQDEPTVAKAIQDKLKVFFAADKLFTDIDINDSIGQVYQVSGVAQVGYLSFDTGDGQWQAVDVPMPNVFTIPNLLTVKVTFGSGSIYV